MGISALNPTLVSFQQTGVQRVEQAKAAQDTKKVEEKSFQTEEIAAVFEESIKTESSSYVDKISAMMAESKKIMAQFQDVFAKYLGGQAEMYDASTWSRSAMQKAFQSATEEELKKAQAAIEQGGYFSVNSVSDRIMEMAMNLSKGDPSKITILRDAVQKGFDQAGAIYGAELPQISHDTYDEVMSRFDAWKESAEKPAVEKEPEQAAVEDQPQKPAVEDEAAKAALA